MNFSDAYIRGRQFFGFLVPGAFYAFSLLCLFNIPQSPETILIKYSSRWIVVVMFLAASYTIGIALSHIGVTGTVLGRLQLIKWKIVSDRKAEIRQTLDGYEKRVIEALTRHYGKDPYVTAIIEFTNNDRKSTGGEIYTPALFNFCKRLLKENTEVVRNDLVIYEEEVNLYAHLPLPLCIWAVVSFIVGLWVRPFWDNFYHYTLPVCLITPGLVVAFVNSVYATSVGEYKEAYESIILLDLTGKLPSDAKFQQKEG